MQGKRYSADSEEGASLWQNLQRGAIATNPMATPGFFDQEQARYGEPVLVSPRLGQGAFRVAITELYRRQCALTGGKVLPALDAAHIRPYAEGGTHTKSNGILLRKESIVFLTLDTQRSTPTIDLLSATRSKTFSITGRNIADFMGGSSDCRTILPNGPTDLFCSGITTADIWADPPGSAARHAGGERG